MDHCNTPLLHITVSLNVDLQHKKALSLSELGQLFTELEQGKFSSFTLDDLKLGITRLINLLQTYPALLEDTSYMQVHLNLFFPMRRSSKYYHCRNNCVFHVFLEALSNVLFVSRFLTLPRSHVVALNLQDTILSQHCLNLMRAGFIHIGHVTNEGIGRERGFGDIPFIS